MKRFAAIFLLLAGACCAFGAEQSDENSGLTGWKWANFVVLAGGLGYLIGKNAGPFFAARSRAIAKDISESEYVRQEAVARSAEVDRRLAALGTDIAQLRADSQTELQAESERAAAHTAAEIAKIQAHAEHEIASAAKAARMELRRYSAQLAIELAEKKVRAGVTPAVEDSLVRSFIHDLQ